MAKRKRVGRPSKLTADTQNELVKLIKAGNYLETAAAYVGLHPDTVREWLRRGRREAKGKHREFSVVIQRAEAFAESSALLRIRAAGQMSWQAEAWYLERKFPAKWGRWERVTHDTATDVDELKDLLKRKDVRDHLDAAASRISMAGDASGDSE